MSLSCVRSTRPQRPMSEAVEVRMPLDPAYGSNFRAEDLEGGAADAGGVSLGGSGDRELRFGRSCGSRKTSWTGRGK